MTRIITGVDSAELAQAWQIFAGHARVCRALREGSAHGRTSRGKAGCWALRTLRVSDRGGLMNAVFAMDDATLTTLNRNLRRLPRHTVQLADHGAVVRPAHAGGCMVGGGW